MTVATTNSTQSFAGAQSALTYTFYSIPDHPEFLRVTLRDTATGNETALTYNSDYTVTQNTSGLGGTVHVIPSYGSGYTQLVWRDTSQTQSSDYDDFNQFPADTLEKDLDRLMCLAQEQQNEIDRSIKNDITNPTAVTFAMIQSVSTTAVTASVLAGNYATSAGTSATAAANSATAASNSTIAAASHSVTALTYSNIAFSHSTTALTHSTSAASYATTALTHSTTASSYSTTALTHSTTAASHATTALTHSTTASSYATTALTYSTLAGYYATTASTAASTASTQALVSASHATTALTHSTTAASYSTTALTHSTTASSHATTALTYSTLAGNYATTCGNLAGILTDAAIQFIIDGGGDTITTGIKGDLEVPFNCTIGTSTLLANTTGSIVIDIWKDALANFPPTDADSITASAAPSISTALTSQDSTLTGWTTSLESGSTLRYNVDSVTDIDRVTLSLQVTRT